MNNSTSSLDIPLPARLFWRSLLLIALLGLGLRMLPLAESLWLDELHTSWTIAGDWNQVADRVLQGNNSPLYFWGLKAWVAIFGDDEWTLRMPSVICGCITLVGTAILVRRWTGSGLAGCVAAALIALDRDMIFYATEARPYAAVQLGCLTLFAITMRLWRDFTLRSALLWVLLAAVTIHLHLIAGLFVAACLPPLILAAWGHAAGKRLLLMLVGLTLMLLPLTAQLSLVYARRSNWATFVHSDDPLKILEILPVIPFGILPGVLAWGLNRFFPFRETAERRSVGTAIIVWSVFATMAPITAAWNLTYFQITPLFLRRYLLGSQALLFVWCGLNVGRVQRIAPRAVLAATLVLSIFYFHLPDHWTQQRRQDWRGAVVQINKLELPSNSTLLIASRLIESDDLEQNEGELADYSRLPIHSIYRTNDQFKQVIPLEYTHAGLLKPWQLKLLAQPQTIVVLTPGDHSIADLLAVQIAQSLPWASSVRILPERQGMQLLLITDANQAAPPVK